MLSRFAKASFYSILGPAMRLNGIVYRLFRAPRSGVVCVQLGPGQKDYIQGWINLDANMFTAKCDVWADLRNPLPFRDNTIQAMYSHHVIEHLPNLRNHFREVYRCLKKGGVYRLGGPNGDSAINRFVAQDSSWFTNFPENRKSIGGRFENFIFCRQEHLTILTYSFLHELLSEAGFSHIESCLPTKETRYPQYFDICLTKEWGDNFEHPHTIILEAVK